MPNVGWANAVPDSQSAVNFVISGSQLDFTGPGYHDKVSHLIWDAVSDLDLGSWSWLAEELGRSSFHWKCRELVLGSWETWGILYRLVRCPDTEWNRVSQLLYRSWWENYRLSVSRYPGTTSRSKLNISSNAIFGRPVRFSYCCRFRGWRYTRSRGVKSIHNSAFITLQALDRTNQWRIPRLRGPNWRGTLWTVCIQSMRSNRLDDCAAFGDKYGVAMAAYTTICSCLHGYLGAKLILDMPFHFFIYKITLLVQNFKTAIKVNSYLILIS